MGKLLQLGLYIDGTFKKITDVDNGLACNCVCAQCLHPLVAKNNKQNHKEAHFAHASGKECEGAVETAIHLLAKQVFAEMKTLKLPPYHHDYNLENSISLYGSADKEIAFDTVLIEESLKVNGKLIRPDAIGIKDGQRILIEFAKTHFIDSEKWELLKLSGFACIELDLNNLPQTWEGITDFLLNSSGTPSNKWITNPKLDKKFETYWKLKQEHEAKQEQERKLRAEQTRLKQEAEREEKIRKHRLDKGIKLIRLRSTDYIAYDCPLKKKRLENFKETDFYKVPVLKRIIDGEFWEGKFYGFFPNGTWIYLKEEKIIVYPPDGQQLEDTRYSPKFIYKGLSTLKEEIVEVQFGRCDRCIHAGDRFLHELFQVCKHI